VRDAASVTYFMPSEKKGAIEPGKHLENIEDGTAFKVA